MKHNIQARIAMLALTGLVLTLGCVGNLSFERTNDTIENMCIRNGGSFNAQLGLTPPSCMIKQKDDLYKRYWFNNFSNDGGCYKGCKLVEDVGR